MDHRVHRPPWLVGFKPKGISEIYVQYVRTLRKARNTTQHHCCAKDQTEGRLLLLKYYNQGNRALNNKAL
jgi:hypothetical protein